MRKRVLIIGDDKMGHWAVKEINKQCPETIIYLNRSVDRTRIVKLLKKRIISLPELFKMGWAELTRKDVSIPDYPIISNNNDVRAMVESELADEVICFRAGLVLNKTTLALSPQFLNVHYADLPEWGGLGAIARSLNAGCYEQKACLHEMVGEIDAGEVYRREPYHLDPKAGYKQNEDNAFQAGLRLLITYLKAPSL